MKKQILTLTAIALTAGAMIMTGCKKDDTTAPVITLIGGNATIAIGATYVDQGATAEDNEDGNLTTSITVTNGVNPAQAGTYTVHYEVADAAGNIGTADRTVTVVNQSAGLAGTYSVKDSVWGGSSLIYQETITASSTVNNRILTAKFGDYVNGAVYIDCPTSTTVAIPSQTVTCGSPAHSHTFSLQTSSYPGSISTTTPTIIMFDYHDIDNTASTFADARATYTKQ